MGEVREWELGTLLEAYGNSVVYHLPYCYQVAF
jgi:hypothetical protein